MGQAESVEKVLSQPNGELRLLLEVDGFEAMTEGGLKRLHAVGFKLVAHVYGHDGGGRLEQGVYADRGGTVAEVAEFGSPTGITTTMLRDKLGEVKMGVDVNQKALNEFIERAEQTGSVMVRGEKG